MSVMNNSSPGEARSGSVHRLKGLRGQGQKSAGSSTLDVLQAATCDSSEGWQLGGKMAQEKVDKGR